MSDFKESTTFDTSMESGVIPPIELVKSAEGTVLPSGLLVIDGLDKTILDGYRLSVRTGNMSPEQAARAYRNWNVNSVFIPEDFS